MLLLNFSVGYPFTSSLHVEQGYSLSVTGESQALTVLLLSQYVCLHTAYFVAKITCIVLARMPHLSGIQSTPY